MEANQFVGMLVIALGSLLGLFFTVGKPILNLNTSINRLNFTIDSLVKNDTKQDNVINEHSKQLGDHENRINLLEHDK